MSAYRKMTIVIGMFAIYILCGMWATTESSRGSTTVDAGSVKSVPVEGIKLLDVNGEPVIKVSLTKQLDFSSFYQKDPAEVVVRLHGAMLGDLEGDLPFSFGMVSGVTTNQADTSDGSTAEIHIKLTDQANYRIVNDGRDIFVYLDEPNVREILPNTPEPAIDKREAEIITAEAIKAFEGNSASPAMSKEAESNTQTEKVKLNEDGAKAEKLVQADKDVHAEKIETAVAEKKFEGIGVIHDIVVDEQGGNTRIRLLGDGDLSSYSDFTLKNPLRIVLDVWNVTHNLKSRKVDIGSAEFSSVRIGAYPDKVRVVCDVAPGMEEIPKYRITKKTGQILFRMGNSLDSEHETESTITTSGTSDNLSNNESIMSSDKVAKESTVDVSVSRKGAGNIEIDKKEEEAEVLVEDDLAFALKTEFESMADVGFFELDDSNGAAVEKDGPSGGVSQALARTDAISLAQVDPTLEEKPITDELSASATDQKRIPKPM